VLDQEADLSAACWARVNPTAPTIGPLLPDPRLPDGLAASSSIAAYTLGARLDEVLTAAARRPATIRPDRAGSQG